MEKEQILTDMIQKKQQNQHQVKIHCESKVKDKRNYFQALQQLSIMIEKLIQIQKQNGCFKKQLNVLIFLFSKFNDYQFEKQQNGSLDYINLKDIFGLKLDKINQISQLLNVNNDKNISISMIFQTNIIINARIAYLLYGVGYSKFNLFKKFYNSMLKIDDNEQKIKQFLDQNKYEYSFNEQIWQKYIYYSKKYYDNSYSQEQNKSEVNIQNIQQKIPQIKIIHDFLNEFGFTNSEHLFNKKMINLTQKQYKQRYVNQFATLEIKQIADIIKNKEQKNFQNVLFYYDKVEITYQRVNLWNIHKKKNKNYRWLQQRHDYIQWLFPNHYASSFNSQSYPLSYLQAQIFKTDLQIGRKLLRSFQIYLDFMGCRIQYFLIKSQQKVQQNIYKVKIQPIKNEDAQSRLYDVVLYNTHNHLRIMRILACLSVTGFRLIALEFIHFLFNLQDHNQYLKKRNFRKTVQKNWKVYDENNEIQKKKALQMCFVAGNEFPDHHPALIQRIIKEKNEQKVIVEQNIDFTQQDLSQDVQVTDF